MIKFEILFFFLGAHTIGVGAFFWPRRSFGTAIPGGNRNVTAGCSRDCGVMVGK